MSYASITRDALRQYIASRCCCTPCRHFSTSPVTLELKHVSISRQPHLGKDERSSSGVLRNDSDLGVKHLLELDQKSQSDKQRVHASQQKKDWGGRLSTGDTMISETLPKSPIMARMEQEPRPKKDRPKGMAKRRLAQNPWAKMLASPLRTCNATAVRIPRDLLLPFNLVQHPTASKRYLMPLKLADLESLRQWKTKEVAMDPKDASSTTRAMPDNMTPDPDLHTGNNPNVEESEGTAVPDATPVAEGSDQGVHQSTTQAPISTGPKAVRLLPTSTLIPRRSLMHYITRLLQPKGRPLEVDLPLLKAQLIPYERIKHLPRKQKGVTWRRDVPELVTSLLRRRALTALENVTKTRVDRKGVELLLPLDAGNGDDIPHSAHTGIVLYFNDLGDGAHDLRTALSTFRSKANPNLSNPRSDAVAFTTPSIQLLTIADETSLPVFDVRSLFEDRSALEASSPDFIDQFRSLLPGEQKDRSQSLWLLRSSHASAVQAIEQLWILSQYLVYDEDPDILAMPDNALRSRG